MSYKAIHYVKLDGRVYAPGEAIDAIIPSEKLDRLLSIGALEITSAPNAYVGAEPESPANSGEPDGKKNNDESKQDDDDSEDDEPAPEIDVTDGIVEQPASERQEKAKTPKKRPSTSRRK